MSKLLSALMLAAFALVQFLPSPKPPSRPRPPPPAPAASARPKADEKKAATPAENDGPGEEGKEGRLLIARSAVGW